MNLCNSIGFRAAIRFYNGLLSSNSATLKQALHADTKLVPRAKTSWASDILRAFEGLRGCDTYTKKCSCAAVQNEVHVLFHCQDLFVCSLRRKYSFLFFTFCQSFSMEAPCIPHALPSQTVFDFLSQRHNRLRHFILDIMDYFLAGEDQQQYNQPNDLAGR